MNSFESILAFHAFCRTIIVLTFLLLLSLVASGNAAAQKDYLPPEPSAEVTTTTQAVKQPGPIPRARWSEDWSTIGNSPPCREDTSQPAAGEFWRPLKYIPLNENGESYLSLGGEARFAYENYDDRDMGISDIGNQDAQQLRLGLHADLHLNKRWRIFTQLGYGTVLDDREGGEKTADETDLDLWEMFVDYRIPVRDNERVVVRVGRQLIETGNLFINAGEGNNVRQVYDGLRVGWLDGDFVKFAAFATEYIDFDDDSFGMSGTDEYFWGLRTGVRINKPVLDLQFLYTGWDLKDRQFEQGGGIRHDEQRHTLILRINRPLNIERQLHRLLSKERQWGVDYYLAYQFGKYEDQPGDSDISAFAGFGEVKYTVYQEANTPILGFKTAYFSGDDDPDDDELNTFYDPVFATPFFGYGRDVQPHNLIFLQPNVGYRFGEQDLLLTLSHGFHWRADTDDAFYASPNGITARAGDSDSSWLGQQTQLSVRYMANPNLLITSYLARFFAGDMLEDAGGDDRDYFHIGFHYLF
jgi:hypothetical protein